MVKLVMLLVSSIAVGCAGSWCTDCEEGGQAAAASPAASPAAGSQPDAAGSAVAGAAVAGDDEDEAGKADEDEVEHVIALDKVPDALLAAARAALPGVELTGAVVEQEAGQLVYELVGTEGGERVEIEVGADGKVLEVERGSDD